MKTSDRVKVVYEDDEVYTSVDGKRVGWGQVVTPCLFIENKVEIVHQQRNIAQDIAKTLEVIYGDEYDGVSFSDEFIALNEETQYFEWKELDKAIEDNILDMQYEATIIARMQSVIA